MSTYQWSVCARYCLYIISLTFYNNPQRMHIAGTYLLNICCKSE